MAELLDTDLLEVLAILGPNVGKKCMQGFHVFNSEDIGAVEDWLRFAANLTVEPEELGYERRLVDHWVIVLAHVSVRASTTVFSEAIGVSKGYGVAVVVLPLGNQVNGPVASQGVGVDLVLQLRWKRVERKDLLLGQWFGGPDRRVSFGSLQELVRSRATAGIQAC